MRVKHNSIESEKSVFLHQWLLNNIDHYVAAPAPETKSALRNNYTHFVVYLPGTQKKKKQKKSSKLQTFLWKWKLFFRVTCIMGKTSPFTRQRAARKPWQAHSDVSKEIFLSFLDGWLVFCSVIAFLLLIEAVSKRKKRLSFCETLKVPEVDVWRMSKSGDFKESFSGGAINCNENQSLSLLRELHGQNRTYFRLPRVEVFCRTVSLPPSAPIDNFMFSSFDSRNNLSEKECKVSPLFDEEIEMLKAHFSCRDGEHEFNLLRFHSRRDGVEIASDERGSFFFPPTRDFVMQAQEIAKSSEP